MVNFKSIADKAKGVFKKESQEKGEEVQRKPEDLLEEIKKYEEKISKKDFSGPGVSELREEVDTGNISDKSYKEVMGALGIKDESVKTAPKKPEGAAEAAEKAPEKEPQAQKEPITGEQAQEEDLVKDESKEAGETPEGQPKKPAGVKVSPKKEETPSQRIMRAMGSGSEEKLDTIIGMLEEIMERLPSKRVSGKRKSAKKSAKKSPGKAKKDHKSMNLQQLYNKAKKLGVKGRSSMSKKELIKALEKAKK